MSYFQTNPQSPSDGSLKCQRVAYVPAMSVVQSCTHHPSLVLLESIDHRFQMLESPSSFSDIFSNSSTSMMGENYSCHGFTRICYRSGVCSNCPSLRADSWPEARPFRSSTPSSPTPSCHANLVRGGVIHRPLRIEQNCLFAVFSGF